jgi:hypothetical protein
MVLKVLQWHPTAILFALALFAAPTCADRPLPQKERQPMTQSLQSESGPFKLELRAVSQDGGNLVLQYGFTNNSRQNAYLFNKIYMGLDDQGKYNTARDLAYVEIDSAKATVGKKIIPVPDDLEVEKPVVPCVTLVEPGKNFEEVLAIRLPLKAWTPYLQTRPGAAKTVMMPLWFEIGYFSTNQSGDALAKTVQTADGLALHFYPFPASSQKILGVGPITNVPAVVVQ